MALAPMTARTPSAVLMAGTGRPSSSTQNSSPRFRFLAFRISAGWGLKIPNRRPLLWAASPATALPSESASSRSNPNRSATTAAHKVSTGARLILILRSVMVRADSTEPYHSSASDGKGARAAPLYLFSVMVGMPRRAVPARVAAGGTNIGATVAFQGVAPLHAARTSQRDVPTTLSTYAPLRQVRP